MVPAGKHTKFAGTSSSAQRRVGDGILCEKIVFPHKVHFEAFPPTTAAESEKAHGEAHIQDAEELPAPLPPPASPPPLPATPSWTGDIASLDEEPALSTSKADIDEVLYRRLLSMGCLRSRIPNISQETSFNGLPALSTSKADIDEVLHYIDDDSQEALQGPQIEHAISVGQACGMGRSLLVAFSQAASKPTSARGSFDEACLEVMRNDLRRLQRMHDMLPSPGQLESFTINGVQLRDLRTAVVVMLASEVRIAQTFCASLGQLLINRCFFSV